MVFLVDIFYDLTCQDLPPGIEDSHAQFFGAQDGLFIRLLLWDPPQLQGEVRAAVCRWAKMHVLIVRVARRYDTVSPFPNQNKNP